MDCKIHKDNEICFFSAVGGGKNNREIFLLLLRPTLHIALQCNVLICLSEREKKRGRKAGQGASNGLVFYEEKKPSSSGGIPCRESDDDEGCEKEDSICILMAPLLCCYY